MQHFTFIGRSNIGKTFQARRLVTQGYEHIESDALIATQLGDLLRGYTVDTDGMAAWMGQPYSDRESYLTNSIKFLELEAKVTNDVLDQIELRKSGNAIIFDATGSVIHIDKKIHNRIRSLTHVIYFEDSPARIKESFESFQGVKKPVCWGEVADKMYDGMPLDALKECYGELLANRAKLYEQMADGHITIPFEVHHRGDFNLLHHLRAV